MIGHYQETDSKVIFALPKELAYPVWVEPTNETIGGRLGTYFFPLSGASNLVRQAWDTTRQTGNQQVAREARRLLSLIQEVIVSCQQSGFDLDYLSPLQAFNVDDGSVLIEWIFSDFRIGFNVEPEPEDSGWYLVSNKNLGEISASGYTSSIDIKGLFLWLVNFVLSNS